MMGRFRHPKETWAEEDQALWYVAIRIAYLTWGVDYNDAMDFFALWCKSILVVRK
jgi:hypothetical protein